MTTDTNKFSPTQAAFTFFGTGINSIADVFLKKEQAKIASKKSADDVLAARNAGNVQDQKLGTILMIVAGFVMLMFIITFLLKKP